MPEGTGNFSGKAECLGRSDGHQELDGGVGAMKSIYKVAVIGGGTMGADLAALVARQDMPVVVKEVNAELAERLRVRLDPRIDGWLERGKISEARAEQLKK